MALRKITQADLKDLQMPPDVLGNPGAADIEALKAVAWGSDYDVDARRAAIEEARNRITAAIIAQQVAAAAPQQTAALGGTTASDASQGVSGQTSSGATDFSSPGNTGPGGSNSFGGSAAPGSDFMGGAPPGASMFGTGDRSSLADPSGMVTAQASMVGEPGWDPASESPTFTEPDAVGVPAGGRTGDDTSQQSQDKQAADQAALAEAAMGRGALTNTTPGKSSFGATDEDALAEGATSTVGDRAALGLPSGSSGLPSMVGAGIPSSFASTVSDMFGAGKNAVAQGWGAVVGAPPGAIPSAREMSEIDRAFLAEEEAGRNQPTPERSFAQPQPGVPGVPGETGVAAPGGFGPGFSEGAVGGYTTGPGSTEGFGAGYSGSASMGNTQGGQGFTAGMPGGAVTPGSSFDMTAAAAFSAGFDAGAAAATAGQGTGEGAGQGGDTSGSGSSSSSSGGDPGGSPGGVG